MIINTGQRTDIPAFYSTWLMNRIREGYVLVRSPYDPKRVFRYRLDPEVVDLLAFCTKDPSPMLKYIDELSVFRQYWQVTITPYGREIEPNVPAYHLVIDSFRKLSEKIGSTHCAWRYDPILLNHTYTAESHLQSFQEMAELLKGYTDTVIISFIDLYEKTKRNYPEVREVSVDDQIILAQQMKKTADACGMKIQACLEHPFLENFGIDTGGCFTAYTAEKVIGEKISGYPRTQARKGCNCLLHADIGAYNTCGHGCRYCYANADMHTVRENMKKHDPAYPMLTGHVQDDDIITDAKQKSWISAQLMLDL